MSGSTLALEADLTLRGESAWIETDPTKAEPWDAGRADGGTVSLGTSGTITAHGGFVLSGTTYIPAIPGIVGDLTSNTTTKAISLTDWTEEGWTGDLAEGTANGSGKVTYDFIAAAEEGTNLTRFGIADAEKTVQLNLTNESQHIDINHLFQNSEIVIPAGSTLSQTFTCAGWTSGINSTNGFGQLTEGDATTVPIRARTALTDGTTTTLSGAWSDFVGSHFLAEGDGATAHGTVAITTAGSLPQSHITIGTSNKKVANLTLTKDLTYTTATNTVLDLRNCATVGQTEGGTTTMLKLGAGARVIF
jgi:hypothetical protein